MGCALCSLLWMLLCRRLSFDSLPGAQVLLTRLFYRYIFIFVFVFFAAVCFGTGSSLTLSRLPERPIRLCRTQPLHSSKYLRVKIYRCKRNGSRNGSCK